MPNFEYPVRCPLMNNEPISDGTCFDIHMVVLGEAPKWTAPKEVYKVKDYVEVYNKCKYHRND